MMTIPHSLKTVPETVLTAAQMAGRHEALWLAADLLSRHPSKLLQAGAVAEELRAEALAWLEQAESNKNPLSPGERKVYELIQNLTFVNGKSPTLQKVVNTTTMCAPAVRLHVSSMCRKGILSRVSHGGITILKDV